MTGVQMKQQKIKPEIFEGYLIIALHPEWMNLFGGIPTFVVSINESCKLQIESQEVIQVGHRNGKKIEKNTT